MNGYTDPATASNMLQASHYDPASGTMKTVAQFLTSPQPIEAMPQTYEPYPGYMVAGTPYPQAPVHRAATWDRASAPMMSLRTLFGRPAGSIAR